MFQETLLLIKKYVGSEFKTKSGLPFSYSITGQVMEVNRTEYNIPVSDIERAYNMSPCDGPGGYKNLVRGPSYIWAILHDSRIGVGKGNTPVFVVKEKKKEEKRVAGCVDNAQLYDYVQDFAQVINCFDAGTKLSVERGIKLANIGSNQAMVELAKTLEGDEGLLSSFIFKEKGIKFRYSKDNPLRAAVNFIESFVPRYVFDSLVEFCATRNIAAHKAVPESDVKSSIRKGIKAYVKFVEWYYLTYLDGINRRK